MKKVLLVFGLGLFLLASCKKDYTCACKSGGQVQTSTTIKDTKKNATATCDKNDIAAVGIDCSIQ